jgi:hypothetical protein
LSHPDGRRAFFSSPKDSAMNPGETTVDLQTPIQRGEQSIARVALRRPRAGALRGIKLLELMQMQAEAVMALLPRITEPPLLAHELDALDPADLITLATEVINFLLPRPAAEQAPPSQSA